MGSKGYYIKPTIFTDVKEGMKIFDEEIFGPVQSIAKFKTLDEVSRFSCRLLQLADAGNVVLVVLG